MWCSRRNFVHMCPRTWDTLMYNIIYEWIYICHRYSGRHFGIPGYTGVAKKNLPFYSPIVFRKSRQGVLVNSKRFRNGSEQIDLGDNLPLEYIERFKCIFLLGVTVPQFWVGVELGSRVWWYSVKVLRIRCNLFAGTETLTLSVYEPITIHIFLGGIPEFGRGVELGGRVCYPLKVLCSRYNLFAGTETLSLSVNEPIEKQILVGGPSPTFGGRVRVRGSSAISRESPSHWA